MSAIDTRAAAGGPLLVVDIHELRDHLRELEGESQDQHGGYSESFGWRKTDIAGGVAVAVTASRQVLAGDVRVVHGWALTETSGTNAAAVRFHEGNGAGGEQFGRINLQANESVRDYFPGKGIRCQTGRVFLEWITGAVEGVLYWS